MSKIENLWNKNYIANAITEKQIIRDNQDQEIIQLSNIFSQTFISIKSIYIPWEQINSFSEDDSEQLNAIYKQWEILIASFPEDTINFNSDLIIPYINYEILYRDEDVASELNFQSTGKELKRTDFFEIRETGLYLHVSVYIKRIFQTGLSEKVEDFYSPELKLKINIINPFSVS